MEIPGKNYHNAMSWLIRLRTVSIISLLALIILIVWGLQIPINPWPPFLIIAAMVLFNTLLYFSLKKPRAVSAMEIAANLTIDALALALLLYFSGGSTNPLVSLFIVPIALSAVFLPVRYIAWTVILTIFLYSLLMEWYLPFPHTGHRFGGSFNLHIIGMYGNFIFSAIIIAVFVYILANSSRKQQQLLAEAREKLIRNQHVVEMGVLAANAAHEINTPLATIGLLSQELLDAGGHDPQTTADIEQIRNQMQKCRQHLDTFQDEARKPAESEHQTLLEHGIARLIDDWQNDNPQVQVDLDIQDSRQTPFLLFDKLIPTLHNLLDNAATASLKNEIPKIAVRVRHSDGDEVMIDVDDYGEGLTAKQLSQLGRQPYSSKPDGMGIGLLLSHTSLENLGGHILLSNHAEQGVRARITLPAGAVS